MSLVNSLSSGYKGKSKSIPPPQLTPYPKDYVLEILTPIKNRYIENYVTSNDILFIIENIKCLKNNTNYNGNITLSALSERIFSLIKVNFELKKLSIEDLTKITEGLTDINLNVTQSEKITKNVKIENIKGFPNPKILSEYIGGSLRIKSKDTPPLVKNLVLEISSSIKKHYIENHLSDNDLISIIKNIKCLKDNINFDFEVNTSLLSEGMLNLIKSNFKLKKLSIDDLTKITKKLLNIKEHTVQNEKKKVQIIEPNQILNTTTLSNYKGGSLRVKNKETHSQPKHTPIEILTPLKKRYIENYLTDDDLTFLKDSIKCLKSNTDYSRDITPSSISEKILDLIKVNFELKKLSIEDLTKITEGLTDINLNVTQSEKIKVKVIEPNQISNTTALSGYKGGSLRIKSDKILPKIKTLMLKLLSSIKKHYIENQLTDDDILFIIENIKCLKNNTDYSGDINSSILTERICIFIDSNYKDEKLTLENLDKLIESFNGFILNVTPNEKIIEKIKVKNTKNFTNPQTLSGYGGGSPRIKSEGNLPKIKPESQKVPIESIISKIKMWHADRNLSDEDINVIMKELIKIK